MLIHLFGMKAALLLIVRQKYKRFVLLVFAFRTASFKAFVLAVFRVRTDSSSCSNCSELLTFCFSHRYTQMNTDGFF